jgi:Aspartate/tyrosine/aromatic aminotransferase
VGLDENIMVGVKFRSDPNPNKVYLNYSYRNEDGTEHAFKSVIKAEQLVFRDAVFVNLHYIYLIIQELSSSWGLARI